MAKPRVEVIIVNWKSYDNTRECLTRLVTSTYENFHITVVDNESDSVKATALQKDFAAITLIPLEENTGFTGGNNTALQHVSEDAYYFLLNDDTLPPVDLIAKLADYLASNPNVGIVGPLVLNANGSFQSAGMNVVMWMGGSPMLPLRSKDTPFPVDAVSGCALMIKGEVIKKIGLLDPDYFMYYEETDWCTRAKRAGYEIRLVPSATVTHLGGANEVSKKKSFEYQMIRNRFRFVQKQGTAIHQITVTLYVALFYLWARTLILLLTGRAALISSFWRGAWRGVRGAAGR